MKFIGFIKTNKLIIFFCCASLCLFSLIPIFYERSFSPVDGLSNSSKTAVVVRSKIAVTVSTTATLEPVDMVAVGAQVNGQIKSVKVKQGDQVLKDQELVLIDPELQQAALDRAKAALLSLEAQEHAKRVMKKNREVIWQRQSRLYVASASTRAELDQAKVDLVGASADLEIVKSQIVQARLDVRSAEVSRTFTRITSPINGEVLAVNAQYGQTIVSAQSSPTLMVVGNIEKMRVRARVSEVDVIDIKPGMRAFFTVTGAPQRTYEGKLLRIEISQDMLRATRPGDDNNSRIEGPVYYYGVFEVDNTDHMLRPFMSADVRIEKRVVRDVLSVPLSAIRSRSDDGIAKIAVRAGKQFVERHVQLGVIDEERVEIKKGLREGEHVAVDGYRPTAMIDSEDARGNTQ
ncbi:efflux RND transporter periplasmic adaptor subunit [Pandoraea sp. NPDC090278]|uniref:efflux RND transporter periplasmic adaptor subunit n=1 Tax=Pandoraea sp. NPDC090278 TaxID=3364391 RepID=UPI00383B825B